MCSSAPGILKDQIILLSVSQLKVDVWACGKIGE